MIRRWMLFVLVLVVSGCPKTQREVTAGGRGNGGAQDPARNVDDVVRDLEATVIELYAQRSGERLAGFADALAREQQLTLVGTAAEDIAEGRYRGVTRKLKRGASRGNRHFPFSDAGANVLSKTLEIHTSPDKSIAWLYDEVSYRVMRDGKQAAIPLRITAVFMLDIDRWTLVMEHVSYALPTEEITRMARSHSLRTPAKLKNYSEVRGPSSQLLKAVRRMHNAKSVGGKDDGGKFRLRKLSQRAGALAVWPAPSQEFRGERVLDAPTLSKMFGTGDVRVHSQRIVVAPNQRHAWMAATLSIDVKEEEGQLSIPLRATYVFELSQVGWQVVQSHISVPIADVQLSNRLFGPAQTPPGG